LGQTVQAYVDAPILLNSGLSAMRIVSHRTIPNASPEIERRACRHKKLQMSGAPADREGVEEEITDNWM
jgi:hypothetical protein